MGGLGVLAWRMSFEIGWSGEALLKSERKTMGLSKEEPYRHL